MCKSPLYFYLDNNYVSTWHNNTTYVKVTIESIIYITKHVNKHSADNTTYRFEKLDNYNESDIDILNSYYKSNSHVFDIINNEMLKHFNKIVTLAVTNPVSFDNIYSFNVAENNTVYEISYQDIIVSIKIDYNASDEKIKSLFSNTDTIAKEKFKTVLKQIGKLIN